MFRTRTINKNRLSSLTKKVFVFALLLFNIIFFFTTTVKAATFTAGSASRDAPGPFTGAPIVQGDAFGTTATGDSYYYARGTAISGAFYPQSDGNQGSVVFWVTPEWNVADITSQAYLVGTAGGVNIYVEPNEDIVVNLADPAYQTVRFTDAASGWTAGTTYNIIVRWDADNTLDGTNYVSLSINDTHTYGRITSFSPLTGASDRWVGAGWNGVRVASALIEGLTVYRRPLFDGTYGIDVGNGDEINKIYNSGTGKDPTLVTGSWDVVFALPTNSSTGALSTTGQAWTHPHASNLLPGNSNKGGFMLNGNADSDGWNAEGTPGLLENIKAYWKLEEASGERSDAIGSNNLTDNNTVTNDTGILGNAAKFVAANSEYLSITDNADLSFGDEDFTITAWVNIDNLGNNSIATKHTNGGAREYALWYNVLSANRFSFGVSDNGSTNWTEIAANNLGQPVADTWYFIVAWHDSVNNTLNIQVNNGTIDSTAYSTGVFDGASNFLVGAWGSTGASSLMDGFIDSVGVWNRVLTSTERAALYNSANGLEHPFASALVTSEKIFAGGYKTTSDAANEGIYQDITVTAGDDWVVRAVAHSDGTSIPKIILYDQTGSAEIGSLTGTTGSTRAAPDVFILTGEAPADCTTLRVKVINTETSGVTYWHQVEVLANLVTNPSMAVGAGTPWVPTGWTLGSSGASSTWEQDTSNYHSSPASFLITRTVSDDVYDQVYTNVSLTDGNYYSLGAYARRTAGDRSPWHRINTGTSRQQSTNASYYAIYTTNDTWTFLPSVNRQTATASSLYESVAQEYNVNSGNIDDFYIFPVTGVSLTVTPASEANSTENTDEIRVDGRDKYLEEGASSITTTSGYMSFDYRPRHSAADAVKFAETTADDAYVFYLYGDSDDYVKVYWDSANTLRMAYNLNGGGEVSGTWDATGLIAANSQYAVVLSYTGGSTMVLNVGGTDRITLSSIPASFGTAPNNVYFGSYYDGSNATLQGDATFSEIVFDNTAPAISLTALSPDPNSDTTPSVTGTATEAVGTTASVEYQMDGTGGSWTACTADDGTMDEAEEAFTCTPSALSDGEHTIYVRATDSNGNTTTGGSESSDTFTIDSTAPTISVTAFPTDPTTDTTPSVTGTATDATTALTAIEYQMDGTSGSWTTCVADDASIDETSEAFTCTPSALSDGEHTIYVRATDSVSNTTSNANAGSDTFTIDTTGSTISSVSSTPSASGATITWTTNETSSSQVEYGLSTSYGSETTETDTVTRVTSHSVTLSSLVACTTYHYRVKSKDTALNSVAGEDKTFTSTGCTGSAAVETEVSSSIAVSSGGTIELLNSSKGISLAVPASFFTSDATFQVKKIAKASVLTSTSTPSNSSFVGDYVYDVKALTNNTTLLSSFTSPVEVTFTYADSDVAGDESTLIIKRWNGSSWNNLSSCSLDNSANTVTCQTSSFSVFSVFSQVYQNSSSPEACGNQVPSGKVPWLYGAIAGETTNTESAQTESTESKTTSTNSITLYFTAADGPLDHYVLEYGTSSGEYTYAVSNIGDKNTSTYTVKGLSSGKTYYFRVRAGNGCASGDWSNELSAKTKGFFSTIKDSLAGSLEFESFEMTPEPSLEEDLSTEYQDEDKTLSDKDSAREYDLRISVFDTEDKPVGGAKITLHSTPRKAITDEEGLATFTDVEEGEHKLLIAYNNYKGEQTINLKGSTKEFSVKVTLSMDAPLFSTTALLVVAFLSLLTFVSFFFLYKKTR
ncbi:fibronectin type III domain-containing protein [Patescibacteria group bacterium]|nr:fibronectin type III domain-containing protein [Patescibacteria group bacterium]